ncbi:hypothetical protein E2320_009300 [Naja naja]|nr:hypothetical protein E2320_009300 [Naja naja]
MAEMAPPLTPAPTPTTTPTPLVRQPSAPSPARAYHLRPAFHHRSARLSHQQPLFASFGGTTALREKGFHRYKIVVQVVIGEQRGEGVNMAARCFWDADTDNYAQDVFINESLFCVAVAFGCFFY